jgi:hypothetical protein
MPTVVLTGWRPGLQKIALDKLLHYKYGLSLKDAFDSVNRCMDGERVPIYVNSLQEAENLAREATELGALVEILPDSEDSR